MNLKALTRFALIAGIASAFVTAQAETYALLIGINDYPDVIGKDGKPEIDKDGKPIDMDLKGAVNDVTLFKEILVKNYSVTASNVHLVTNKDANQENFIKEWKWILSTAKPGDQVLFYYSGHGGQIPSKDPKETDGLDEVIVLGDNALVQDKLFAEIAKMVSDSGVNATFIFDSCFSGGISREPKPGEIKKTFDLSMVSRKVYKEIPTPQLNGVKATFKGKAAQAKGDFAFIMAGQEKEPTLDISGLKDVPAHGLFTLFFTAALQDNPSMGLKEVLDISEEYVVKSAEKLKGQQKPMSEFSSADRARKPLVYKS